VAARELKSIATELLKNLGEGIVTLVATADQKASIVVAVSPDMTARFDAVALARAAAAAVGGTGGGGSRTMAQAGGPHGDDWEAALAAVRAALAVETAAR
jgi:alanyl-tRNA synthetase